MNIIPRSHLGRSRTGKFAFRAALEPTEADFPPDSNYWRREANGTYAELQKFFPDEQMDVWMDETFPDGTPCNWKLIALKERELLHTTKLAQGIEKS